MVFESEDVSLSSVARGGDSARHRRAAEASDRSLSYVDLSFTTKIITGNKKVFESVRKFGRPRQQCSDPFAVLTSEDNGCRKDKYGRHGERHSGTALKEHRYECDEERVKRGLEKEEEEEQEGFDYMKLRETCECDIPRARIMQTRASAKLSHAGDDSNEFENRMYRWNERDGRTLSRRSSAAGEGSAARREPEEADVEAQIRPRIGRDGKKSDKSDFDYYEEQYENRSRISDVRENWRLRVLREDEERMRIEENRRRRLNGRRPEENELHRSKSTPDMIDVEEEWPEEDDRKVNASLVDVSSRNWGVYNEQQEADSLNDPTSLNEPVSSPESLGTHKEDKRLGSRKNFFGHFATYRATTPSSEMLDYKEPFSQFWMVLSTLYGQALVILMMAFCLTEVMDNPVKLLSLQGVFLMYLYVGSIAVIICIYIWVLVDSCSSLNSSDATGLVPPTITTSIVPDGRERDLRNVSVTKFGSLKKAHISRDRTSSTNFYLRVGAIAFGLGTLVFNGLEMAMHSMMEVSCLNDVVFVHPILHGLFTFLQMHFLFVNSQVLVEKFGLVARFGFMHLTATNLALWIRLIIWESGNEWTYFVHLSQSSGIGAASPDEVPTPLQLRGFPKFVSRKERDVISPGEIPVVYKPISDEHISQVVSLHHCLNTNSLGQLWTSSMPFLYPFIIQFSLIAAAVTFVMGQNVAKDRLFFQKQKKTALMEGKSAALPSSASYDAAAVGSWSVDCNRASKGLFLGLLCLVTGVVVIIIFLVVKEDEDFPTDTIFWLTNGTLITILSVTVLVNVLGLVQIRKLSVVGRKMTKLDRILSAVSVLGVQLYAIFGVLVGAAGIALDDAPPTEGFMLTSNQKRHAMLLSLSLVQLVQVTMQSAFIGEAVRRTCLSRNQVLAKPARQVATFLLFGNAVLWAFDTFVVQSWMSQELPLRFFGVLAWGVISRVGLPLLVFFRFHSCVLLLEIWKRSYQSLHLDPGN